MSVYIGAFAVVYEFYNVIYNSVFNNELVCYFFYFVALMLLCICKGKNFILNFFTVSF